MGLPTGGRSLAAAAVAAIVAGATAGGGARAAATFTRITRGAVVSDGGTTFGHGWGDYDGDGDLDLLACNLAPGEPNFLYRNDGGGSFARTSGSVLCENGPSASPAWGDWDNDGDVDLCVANGGTTGPAASFLYRNEGDGRFARVATGEVAAWNGASSVASWADFDNDGDLDLFLGRSGAANRFFTNNGDGTFAPGRFPDGGDTWGASFADYDDDNDLDLFCANWGVANYLYRNDGAIGYTRVTDGPPVTGVAKSLGGSWGDYDNDLDLDLYVTQTLGPNRLFRNDGGGSFHEVESGPPVTDSDDSESSGWADIDNDGDLDLVVSGGGNVAVGTNVIYENDGRGSFSRVTTGEIVTIPGRYEGLSCVDFDDDGDVDVFLSNYADLDNQLYRNDGDVGAWLGLSLRGTVSSSDAIGARVIARARIGGVDRRQMREKTSHTGHVAQGDPRLHFGLADATVVDSLTIRWPSGLVETYTNVGVNRYLSLTEGAGVLTPTR